MLAALILRTFHIAFSGHRITPCFHCVFPTSRPKIFRAYPTSDNAIQSRGVPRSARSRPKSAGTQIRATSFDSRITYPKQEDSMRSKLAISALVVASLFGATAIASAQMQPAPGASSEGNVGPGATASGSQMKSHKVKSQQMKSSKMKSGTTTGMSTGSRKGEARNPASQGSAGSDDNAAKKGGSK
jgi:hypothetical protein